MNYALKNFVKPRSDERSLLLCYSLIIIVIITAISNVSFSQGRRDKYHINQNYNQQYNSDTSKQNTGDTLLSIDTTRLAPVDSTARLKYFKYVPEYTFGTRLPRSTSPLLLGNSSAITYETDFDSSGNVVVREKFDGEDIRAPLVIPLDKYLSEMSQSNFQNIFSQLVSEKFQGSTQDDISKLFEKFTDITIPLPFKSESIFGPPTFNLKINGSVDITASYQNSTTDQTNITTTNANNSINFKQEVQLTAKGKVGDKLTIDADYNTQRLFDFENQLKIKYEGYADEVIKRIEGGNVSLQTKSGLIGSSQALFGVVGDFQLGALSLSAVVSQKKSKTETKSYSGGASEQTFEIKAYDYSDNNYFLDTAYRSSFIDFYNNPTISLHTDSLVVDEQSLEVWVQTEATTTTKRRAGLHVDLYPLPLGGYNDSLRRVDHPDQGLRTSGFVRKLDKSEYTVNTLAGFITLKTSLPDTYFAGVAYKRTKTLEQFGTISTDTSVHAQDTLVLKMVKVNTLIPSYTLAWEHKLKNIYRLPVTRVVREGFEFDIKYLNDNVEQPSLPNISTPLITILGLDKYTNQRTPPPDQKFDFLPGYTIDPENGYIIFPTLKPFLNNLSEFGNGAIDSSYWYPQIYTDLKTNAQQVPNSNKYIFRGKAKGEAGISNTINLGFNIVQGSVVVKLGEQPLVLNTDYTVDYTTGIVNIKNAAALLSKDLRISYETNDLFTLASKTFLGLRGDYQISDKSSFGFTFVNLKQETLNDKVRIGEEPTNNSMFGIDFTTELPSKFLTSIVNLLPGYNTKEPSYITLRGEIAAINPDPNTKKSVIPQDNNEAVAYVDDMEGAKKLISLGTTYTSWTTSSVPLDNFIGPQDSIQFKQRHRGKLKWYNVINGALLTDIYPLKDVQSTQNNITPYYMTYRPDKRGTYNYNAQYESSSTIDRSKTWNGVMKFLNTTSSDLVNENINFIEFSMKVDKPPSAGTGGKLIIDLGNISQDAIPNGKLDSEDPLQSGELRAQDDIGLDYKTNSQEDSIWIAENGSPSGLDDPAGDDNLASGIIDYNRINGTQNNLQFDNGRRPDTEDLNKLYNVGNGNDYFQYEISLETTNNPYIVGSGNNGWKQYKIPLSEFKSYYGNAVFTNIQFARMWITGVTDSVSLTMYDMNLTGNQWIKPNKRDTTYNITVVSIEENPQTYMSPIPGDALRQTIRGQNNVNTKSNEQSLSVEVFNLTSGVRKVARKDFNSAPLDLFNYRSLKLFVNGDPSFRYLNDQLYDAAMVIRFGNDSNNYYEYRAPIHPDNRPGQPWDSLNSVTINFNDLTKIKLSRDSTNVPVQIPVPNGPPGSEYKVFGNPDLQTIREIILGVEKNRSSLNSAISGSVWFNELRLVNVIDDDGIAFNLNATAKLADLLQFNFNLAKTDPFFHSLDTRVGSRMTGLAWDFSATLNLHKFINNMFSSIFSEEWSSFINLPVTFRHSENLIKPKYFPGSDIELQKAADEKYNRIIQQTGDVEQATTAKENLLIEAQTLTVRNSLSIDNMQFNLPSNNYFIKNIFNQIHFSFNTDFGNSRDLTYENRDDFRYSANISIGTDFGLSDKLNLNIGDLIPLGEKYKTAKLYFFLPFIPLAPLFSQNFSASTNFDRSHAESKQRRFSTNDLPSREFRAKRGFRFDWKFLENWIVDVNGTYDFNAGSDLTPYETLNDSARSQRSGGQIFDDIFFNNGVINFGKDLDYSQTVTINPRLNLPFIDRFLTVSGNYNVRYGWVNPNQVINVGYNTNYVNSISSTADLKISEIFSLFGNGSTENKLRANGAPMDTVKEEGNKQSILDIFKLFKTLIPGDIAVTYTQGNQVANTGVTGLPGFGNFWFYPGTKEDYGPSRMYQLGFSLYAGPRAPNLTQIGDNYTQANELSLTASINPLIPEAISMSLTFKKSWGFSNNLLYTSNAVGDIGNPTSKSSTIASGNSMFFAGSVDNFTFQYDPTNATQSRISLTNSFKSQIGSFPFPNWTLNVSGLEKFPFFANFANTVSLENSFVSEYKESRLIDINNSDIPNAQTVTQAFAPLIGLNFNFKEMFGGNLTSTLRLNNSISHSLNPIGAQIQTVKTNEWSINANFSKTGFNLPLFGLSLQNDIQFALTLSKTTNEPINYEFGSGFKVPVAGNGSSVTTVNPTIQYSLSSKVSMQLFYKYIKTQPTGQTVTTVPRTTNEGGLNIRITIQ